MRYDKVLIAWVVALIAMILLCLMWGCRSSRSITNDVRDSVRYETHYTREVVYDTIDVEIPHLTAERFTPDSFSLLENEVAISEAEVKKGQLRHTLETKPQIKRVEVVKEVVTKDTVIYKDREVQVEKVTEKPIPFWQKVLLWLSPFLIVICGVMLIWVKFRSKI